MISLSLEHKLQVVAKLGYFLSFERWNTKWKLEKCKPLGMGQYAKYLKSNTFKFGIVYGS